MPLLPLLIAAALFPLLTLFTVGVALPVVAVGVLLVMGIVRGTIYLLAPERSPAPPSARRVEPTFSARAVNSDLHSRR